MKFINIYIIIVSQEWDKIVLVIVINFLMWFIFTNKNKMY